jgi:hypothetical protein
VQRKALTRIYHDHLYGASVQGAYAGLAIGLADVDLLGALQYRAEAEMARLAGADETQLAGWIEISRKRAEQARLRPYTG